MSDVVALNWIDGDWIDGRRETSHNPATSEVIGKFADGGRSEAELGVAAARRAFEDTDWRHDRQLRAKVLNEMADRFEQNAESLGSLLTSENGKPRGEAGFELSMVAPKLRYFASLALTTFGRALQPAKGRYSVVVREPIGVAGIIVPWNSPVILLIRSLAPALSAGATVVAKMPSQTAQTNAAVAKVFSTINALPRGVVNLFTETGLEGARFLVDSPHVPAVSFTGSTHVGRVIATAGGKQLKRLNLELGGKTPVIIFDDADVEALIHKVAKGVTVFAGQFCMTGSRILVQRGIADQVRSRLASILAAVRVGPGTDPKVDMGPMIDKQNVARVDRCVEEAIAAGAKVIVRGGPATDGHLARGAFYRPTLLEVADSQLDIIKKETFGPVATLQVFDSEAEAIALANETEFGLACGIWTRDVDRPWRVGAKVRAGTVWINDWAVVYDECEEGGYSQSGIGRFNGTAALDAFTEFKHITINSGPDSST